MIIIHFFAYNHLYGPKDDYIINIYRKSYTYLF